jgi:hypothetical protein
LIPLVQLQVLHLPWHLQGRQVRYNVANAQDLATLLVTIPLFV